MSNNIECRIEDIRSDCLLIMRKLEDLRDEVEKSGKHKAIDCKVSRMIQESTSTTLPGQEARICEILEDGHVKKWPNIQVARAILSKLQQENPVKVDDNRPIVKLRDTEEKINPEVHCSNCVATSEECEDCTSESNFRLSAGWLPENPYPSYINPADGEECLFNRDLRKAFEAGSRATIRNVSEKLNNHPGTFELNIRYICIEKELFESLISEAGISDCKRDLNG